MKGGNRGNSSKKGKRGLYKLTSLEKLDDVNKKFKEHFLLAVAGFHDIKAFRQYYKIIGKSKSANLSYATYHNSLNVLVGDGKDNPGIKFGDISLARCYPNGKLRSITVDDISIISLILDFVGKELRALQKRYLDIETFLLQKIEPESISSAKELAEKVWKSKQAHERKQLQLQSFYATTAQVREQTRIFRMEIAAKNKEINYLLEEAFKNALNPHKWHPEAVKVITDAFRKYVKGLLYAGYSGYHELPLSSILETFVVNLHKVDVSTPLSILHPAFHSSRPSKQFDAFMTIVRKYDELKRFQPGTLFMIRPEAVALNNDLEKQMDEQLDIWAEQERLKYEEREQLEHKSD